MVKVEFSEIEWIGGNDQLPDSVIVEMSDEFFEMKFSAEDSPHAIISVVDAISDMYDCCLRSIGSWDVADDNAEVNFRYNE